jgi:hypothetical protein
MAMHDMSVAEPSSKLWCILMGANLSEPIMPGVTQRKLASEEMYRKTFGQTHSARCLITYSDSCTGEMIPPQQHRKDGRRPTWKLQGGCSTTWSVSQYSSIYIQPIKIRPKYLTQIYR